MFSSLVLATFTRTGSCLARGNASIILRQAHRAAVLHEIGKPLLLETVKRIEQLKDDEVRIKVHYCSLNSTDVQIITGKHPELQVPLPFIPGHEISGEIVEIGQNNPNFLKRGDRVVVMNDLQDPNGGLVEEVVVKNRDVWPVPTEVPLKEMTVMPYGHGTALLAFAMHCQLQENDLVLITAGPAGMGLAAIDLAVAVYKAKVIAICDTESSSDLVREKGAYKTVSMGKNYTKLYKNLSDAMGDKKAKVAYDAVGKGMLHLLADFVDPEKGQMFSVDPFHNQEKLKASKPEYELPKKKERSEQDVQNAAKLIDNVVHIDLYEHPDEDVYRQMISDTIEMKSQRMVSGYISKVFLLKSVQKAVEFIQQKQCTGKVLIDVKCLDDDDCEDAEAKKKDLLIKHIRYTF